MLRALAAENWLKCMACGRVPQELGDESRNDETSGWACLVGVLPFCCVTVCDRKYIRPVKDLLSLSFQRYRSWRPNPASNENKCMCYI